VASKSNNRELLFPAQSYKPYKQKFLGIAAWADGHCTGKNYKK
jgi:hypothetical protein